MRASVLCVIIALGSAYAWPGANVQLVSQSAKGPVTGAVSSILKIPWLEFNGTGSGTMSFNMDVTTGSLRMDLQNFTTSGDTKGTKPGEGSVILSGKTKRLYVTTKWREDSRIPDEDSDSDCQFYELPSLPEPSQYVACAESLLQKGKKWFKKENVYVVTDNIPEQKLVGPITLGGSMNMAIQIDSGGRIPKIDFGLSMTLLAIPLFIITAEWSAAESSFGSPNSSVFEVPAEWGKCVKQEIDSTKFSKVEREWLNCVQPQAVLSDVVVV